MSLHDIYKYVSYQRRLVPVLVNPTPRQVEWLMQREIDLKREMWDTESNSGSLMGIIYPFYSQNIYLYPYMIEGWIKHLLPGIFKQRYYRFELRFNGEINRRQLAKRPRYRTWVYASDFEDAMLNNPYIQRLMEELGATLEGVVRVR